MYICRKKNMSLFKFKQVGRISLFDKNETSEKLSKLGNPLEKLFMRLQVQMYAIVNP